MIKAFAEFLVVGMAFSFILLVSFLLGYKVGQDDLTYEANNKISKALKLEVE